MSERVAVITLAAGRHEHLQRQIAGLTAGERQPDLYIVAAMGDPAVDGVVSGAVGDGWRVEVVTVAVPESGELPLAAARNRAAALAVADGAEVLVFLDVDCVPGPTLVSRYAAVARQVASDRPSVLAGTVAYLPPPGHDGYALDRLADLAPPHPARPVPGPDEVLRADDVHLFWSLSFAVRAADWQRLGGFCEEYVGYGGEDTDFAMTLAAAGGSLWWVGGAPAFHQHHPVESPPHRHTDAIVRNANLFQSRWGWFPMEGWLAAFARAGTAFLDEDSNTWRAGSTTRRYAST